MTRGLAQAARRKLAMLDAAEPLDDLRVPSGNRLEALRGDRAGQHSIRINGQWRLVFVWRNDGPHEVEIVDNLEEARHDDTRDAPREDRGPDPPQRH